jgi:Bcr/CflA subfamily drug resistance transporter
MQQQRILPTVLLLAPFILSFAIALDIYAPSIPDVRDYFSTTSDVVQLTIGMFLLMTGLGQLIVGPMADAFGRRKIIILSTLIYFVASVICAISPNMTILISGRMAQGFGACGMMVTCFSIVRDSFPDNECARIYSFLNSSIALSPLLAPSIGGYLALYFGWRSAFAFLALVAFFITLLAIFKIKESLPCEKRVKLSRDTLKNYKLILKSKTFRMYVFCAAAGFSALFTFVSVSPYIIINLLHTPKQHFGLYIAIVGLVFFSGSLLSGCLVKKIGTYKTVLIGLLLMLLAGVMMLLCYLSFRLSIYGLMGPMIIMNIGGAFLMGAGAGGAIKPFPEMAGAASALFGASQFILAFIVTTIVLEWEVVSTLPLALTIIALGAIAFITYVMSYRECCNRK